jgi:hypothetical protein
MEVDMKRILLIGVTALALTACGQGPVDPAASQNSSVTVPLPAANGTLDEGAVAAEIDQAGRDDALTQLSNAELTRMENACIASDDMQCEAPIDAEWHRRGFCADDATGRRKPNCTKAEIAADVASEEALPS